MADAKMMWDKPWEGSEPRPPVEVIGTLSFVPKLMGMSDEDANGWTSVILTLCSMPEVFRQAVRTKLKEATFYLDERVEVVEHDKAAQRLAPQVGLGRREKEGIDRRRGPVIPSRATGHRVGHQKEPRALSLAGVVALVA